MSGTVTYEQITTLFAVIVAGGGAVTGFLAWLWRIVSAIKKGYELDRERLAADIKAGEDALTEYKSHVAETYASKSGVTVQIERLETAVNGIADKVDNSSHRITERIDRLLENQAHNASSTPRRRSPS